MGGPKPYLRCSWCHEVYPTEENLVDTFNAMLAQDQQDAIDAGWDPVEPEYVVDADEVHFCPLCQHDL